MDGFGFSFGPTPGWLQWLVLPLHWPFPPWLPQVPPRGAWQMNVPGGLSKHWVPGGQQIPLPPGHTTKMPVPVHWDWAA